MGVINWGVLTKSQADNELIEEAIARLIAEHNADETAHVDTGQSLESHKSSVIIDHSAGSVVEDKIDDEAVTSDKITANQVIAKDFRTASGVGSSVDGIRFYGSGFEVWEDGEKEVEFAVGGIKKFTGDLHLLNLRYNKETYIANFESVDCYYQSESGPDDDIKAMDLSCYMKNSTTPNNITRLTFFKPFGDVPALAKNPSIEFYGNIRPTYSDVYIVSGAENPWSGSSANYFGFKAKYSDGKLYFVYKDDGDSEVETEVSGIDPDNPHRYRLEYNATANSFKVYIDGVLTNTITPDLADFESDGCAWMIGMKCISTDYNNDNIKISNLIYQQDY